MGWKRKRKEDAREIACMLFFATDASCYTALVQKEGKIHTKMHVCARSNFSLKK